MDFTKGQLTIIRNVCKLQSDSAIRLISNRMKIDEDDSYQSKHMKRMMEDYHLDETDLLDTFTDICEDFDKLHINPSLLPSIGQSSLKIFTKIFREYSYSWSDLYPNAHSNLEKKLDTIIIRIEKSDTNINLN
mgnify:FL=1|tara:strand:+ start:1716 stop:2114 length:399 start_codon:yes stop_codon:yes gene_type:complete